MNCKRSHETNEVEDHPQKRPRFAEVLLFDDDATASGDGDSPGQLQGCSTNEDGREVDDMDVDGETFFDLDIT
jgi:hypothetical protein